MSDARNVAERGAQPEATLRHLAETALQDEESWARLVHAEEEALARALPPGLPAPLRPKPSTPPQELIPEISDAHRDDGGEREPSVTTETGQLPAEAAPPLGTVPRPSTTTAQPVPRPAAVKLDLTDLFGERGRPSCVENRTKVDDLFSGQSAGGSLLGSSSARGSLPPGKVRGSLFGDADDPLFSSLSARK